MELLNELRREAGLTTLLSRLDSNPKVAKNGKLGVLTAVLHLAPGNMSGHEVCPKRTPGCTAACLHFAGSPAYLTAKTRARVAKTKLFFANRDLFMNILALEIDQHLKICERRNLEPAARLNATSDICWEAKRFNLLPEVAEHLGRNAPTIDRIFPTLQFYDYTAVPGRRVPNNYHLTFSLKEQNMNQSLAALRGGLNVAAVFEDGLPDEYLGYPVINGDEHDYRPADPKGVIVGLKVKGKLGKRDASGFVQNKSPALLLAA